MSPRVGGRGGEGGDWPTGEREEETELGLLCCTCDACRDGMLLIQREMLEYARPRRTLLPLILLGSVRVIK